MKTRVKQEARLKDKTLDDMRRFYRSLDFKELWEDFFTSVKPNGARKWKSAMALAKALGKNAKQVEFLAWALGPKDPPNAAMIATYQGLEPLEFDKKREDGGWFTETNLKAHSADIRRQIDALAALRAVGNGITIHSLARMEHLAQALDAEFGGRFFVDGLTLKENKERARLYLSLHQQLLGMIAAAQDLYAKSHGINFSDMSGFERLLAAQAMATAALGQTQGSTRTEGLLNKLITLTLEKAVERGLPIPADVEQVIKMVPDRKKSVM